MNDSSKKKIVIIGAGPAGLTAGVELVKADKFKVDILEKDSVVGGISKTTSFKGCKFDIGPHHFITESAKIEKWWFDLMEGEKEKGNEFVPLRRFTRIFYNNHFFHYPLQPMNVLKGLSLFECLRCVLSYVKIRFFPIKKVNSFQDWVTNKFGHRLFGIFFKTYTEKVWGISCKKISADWAAQRIKGFSLSQAIFYAFFGRWFKKNAPRTLSDKFYYPEQGAGTLWEKVADRVKTSVAGKINLDEGVVSVAHKENKITSLFTKNTTSQNRTGAQKLNEYESDYVFSTMPLRDLILSMDPLPNKKIVKAAKKLCYRGLIMVNFIVDKKDICPDHWVYIHEKSVKMGRIGNMNNFSMKMVNNSNYTALGLEYFTFTSDAFWKKSDEALLNLGRKELEKIGIVDKNKILDGFVMRVPEAYPVYDEHYEKNLGIVLDYLKNFSNLHLMGRNGLHRYNNMDISMLSAMEGVDKVLDQEQNINLDNINFIKEEPSKENIF